MTRSSAKLPCKSQMQISLIFLLLLCLFDRINPYFRIFRLQQVADAGISIILLVAFSLVIAGASIYIVNERIHGEKLQQKLCGVSFKTYWGVAFAWDFAVSLLQISIAPYSFRKYGSL